MKKRTLFLRGILLFAGCAGLFWFVTPLAVRVLNIGNITGMILSLALVGWGMFFPQIQTSVHKWQKHRSGRVFLKVFSFVLALIVLSGVLLSCFMVAAAVRQPPENATVVVLGCKVNGTEPSLMLTRRLQAAQAYLFQHPDAPCIVSGGQGSNEEISEAQAMKTWLIAHGIDQERIYLEDQSTNTDENIRYSQQIIQEHHLSENVAIVTDGFHQLRASLIVKGQGLTPSSVSADTPWFVFSAYYVRELYALVEQLILK